jgi:gliding motility-associated-like protein
MPSGVDSLCIENRFGQVYTTPSQNGQAYNWNISGGSLVTSPGATSITVDWDTAIAVPSIGRIWLDQSNIIDSLCFAASDTLRVYLEPAPDQLVTINLDDTSFCAFDDIDFGLTHDPLLNFISWDFGDGTKLDSVSISGPFSHSYDPDGIYTISVEAYTGSFCKTLASGSVDIRVEKPYVSITGEEFACQGKEGYVYQALDTAMFKNTYQWFVVNGTATTTTDADTLEVPWDNTDMGTVRIVGTSPKGCVADTFDFDVTLNPILTTQIPTGDDFLCADDAEDRLYSVNPTDGYAYNWQIDFGSITSGNGTSEVTVDWEGEGTGRIWLGESHVVDTLCFGASDTLFVTINPPLDSIPQMVYVTNLAGLDNTLEIGWQVIGVGDADEPVVLFRENEDGTDQLQLGSFGKPSGTFTDSPVNPNDQIYNYWITVSNKCGVTDDAEFHSNILLTVEVDEDEDQAILDWNEYQGWTDGVSQYDIYHRSENSPTYQLISQEGDNGYIYEDALSAFEHCFYLEAREQDGNLAVSRSNEVCVTFEHKVQASEIFTPNNDGFNDFFVIESLDRYPENKLVIFNRWGQEFYAKTDYDNTWNGTTQDGTELLEGPYFYVFTYTDPNGAEQVAKGAFTIVR